MRYYEVKRTITAKPDLVWSILTDPAVLSDGSFSILRIEGAITASSRIDLWSEVAPKQKFSLKISSFDPGRSMVWESGMPLGLFRGARSFEVQAAGPETLFRMREDYSGPLAGLMVKMIPDLQPSFDTFGDALKAAAEVRAA
ncbi:MAG: SRPBCC domain-containing protein [Pseudomonadota bacterium]